MILNDGRRSGDCPDFIRFITVRPQAHEEAFHRHSRASSPLSPAPLTCLSSTHGHASAIHALQRVPPSLA